MSEDHTLDYLKESLSNWVDTHKRAMALYKKLEHHHYENEEAFAKALSPEEIHFLSEVLAQEIEYADQEQDDTRKAQLMEMNEQLY